MIFCFSSQQQLKKRRTPRVTPGAHSGLMKASHRIKFHPVHHVHKMFSNPHTRTHVSYVGEVHAHKRLTRTGIRGNNVPGTQQRNEPQGRLQFHPWPPGAGSNSESVLTDPHGLLFTGCCTDCFCLSIGSQQGCNDSRRQNSSTMNSAVDGSLVTSSRLILWLAVSQDDWAHEVLGFGTRMSHVEEKLLLTA